MARQSQADKAAEIKALMRDGQTAELIMSERPDLADGWNIVARDHVAKQPSRGPGPDRPILGGIGSASSGFRR